ncbi:hypothetical protein B0H21DRAFT_724571 [Amylocystis lapponica]|nr:hypothetical protein B0H21DRAFT_724571 [Amylocystis lapponica]
MRTEPCSALQRRRVSPTRHYIVAGAMATITVELSPGTVQEILDLQVEELVRLRRRLAEVLGLNAKLEAECAQVKEQLRKSEAESARLRHLADPTVSVPLNGQMTCDDPVDIDIVDPDTVVEEPVARPQLVVDMKPLQKLVPFCVDPQLNMNAYSQKAFGDISKPCIAGKTFLWDDFPETGYMLRSVRRISKAHIVIDNVQDLGMLREGEVQLITLHNDKWCYLGNYTIATEASDKTIFRELSAEMQQALISSAAPHKFKAEVREMMDSGTITISKHRIRRIGYDAKMQEKLLQLMAPNLLASYGKGLDFRDGQHSTLGSADGESEAGVDIWASPWRE